MAVSLSDAFSPRWKANGGADTSGTFDVAAGDLLVMWIACGDATSGRTFSAANSGTDLGWTRRAGTGEGNDNVRLEIHTAYASGAQTGITATATPSVSGAYYRWGVLKVTGHNESTFGGNTAAPATDITSSPYTIAITSSATSSVLLWVAADWGANAWDSPWVAPVGSSQVDYYRDSSYGTTGCAYTTGLTGSQSVGITETDSGWDVRVAAIEIRASAGDPTASIPTTVGLAATATVTRGKPTYRAAGSLAYSTNGGTSVAPGYPSGLAAGDLLVCFVGQKPATANGGTCTTPSGWVLAGSLEEAGGYSTTLGADTGNTNLFCYTKTATGSESGTLSITVGDNNVCWAQILAVEGQTGEYDTAAVTGSDTAAGNISVTFGSNPGITTGQLLIAAWCQPTDVSTPSQFSAQAITATDLTVGTAVEISEPDSSVGNDIGGMLCYAYTTAGTASAAPVLTATAGGTTTNVRGPAVLLRVADLVAATATMPTTAGLAADATVTAGGIDGTATIPTTAGLAATGLAERNATGTIPTTTNLAATGALSLAGATGTIPTTATLAATATVERNGAATIPTTSALAGAAVVEDNGTATIPTTATLAGTAVPGRNATGTVPITAGLAAAGALDLAGVTGTIPTTVGIAATGAPGRNAASTVATTAGLAGTATADRHAIGTIPTTVGLAATGLPERNATGTIPTTAALTAAGEAVGAGGATLPVTVALAADASVDHYATTGIPATAGLASAGLAERNATTGIPATATLAATGLVETTTAATIPTTVTVTADATVETTGTDVNGTATVATTAAITATGEAVRPGSAALPTTFDLALIALAERNAGAGLAAILGLTGTGLVERTGTTAFATIVGLTATAYVEHSATAAIPTTFAAVVIGDAGSRGAVTGASRTGPGISAARRAGASLAGVPVAAPGIATAPPGAPALVGAHRTGPTVKGA